MVLARAVKDVKAKNFGNNACGIAGAVQPVVRELVRRNALRVKRAEAGFIAKERTAGHGHAASKQRFNRGIKPNDGNTLRTKKFGSTLLSVSSPAQSKHEGFLCFRCAAEDRTELLSLKRAKGGFTKTFEEFRDTQAAGFLDAVVEINKAPGKLAREQRADGGLAGAHESGETNDGGARHAPSKRRILRHDAICRREGD